MLDQREILPWLLERGFVDARTIVEDGLTIEDASRHNRNFRVVCGHARSLLLKQSGGATGFATAAWEADMLSRLADLPAARLAPFLPVSLGFDRAAGVLVIELLRDAQDLRAWHNRFGRFPRYLAAHAGDILGRLHRVAVPDIDRRGLDALPRHLPPVLTVDRPSLAMIQTVSGGNLRLLTLIQHFPALCASLDAARQGWRPTALIHGDARWDNFLVVRPDAGSRRSTLRLIDWETASIGDPCWDAGSFMSEYIGHWLLSIPTLGDVPPDRLVALAGVPLTRLQPALGAFWRAYVGSLGLTVEEEREWRQRAVRYAAIRLIDRACEQMDGAPRLTGAVYSLLQTSLNMVQRPDDAARTLLGIAPVEEAAA